MTKNMMDCAYFGDAIRTAKQLRINLTKCAKLFGILRRTFQKFETGTKLIPEDILVQLLRWSFIMLRAHSISAPASDRLK